jgi:lipoprotein-anchoring transpeptidase ErfK/SrfK
MRVHFCFPSRALCYVAVGFAAAQSSFAQISAPVVRPPQIEVAELTVPLPFSPTPTPVTTWRDAQIALARLGISSGSIDGIAGAQTARALQTFQRQGGLPLTGLLDTATCARLVLTSEPIEKIYFSAEDLGELQMLSPTWLGKSEQRSLGFETALEWAAERGHAHPNLIRQLNPQLDWSAIPAGTWILVPAIQRPKFPVKAAKLYVSLGGQSLEARNATGDVLAHFPVSIAAKIEKRPEGELRVTVVIPNPDYTFDPSTFPESDEGQKLGRKLLLPPGPNNPVGVAWIGLDLPGYGIHGTPTPEKIGRTESHGCFRLTNWDALTLVDLAWVGLPVIVEP